MLNYKVIFEPIIDEDVCKCAGCGRFVTPNTPIVKCQCGVYTDFSFMGWSRFDNSKVILSRIKEILENDSIN